MAGTHVSLPCRNAPLRSRRPPANVSAMASPNSAVLPPPCPEEVQPASARATKATATTAQEVRRVILLPRVAEDGDAQGDAGGVAHDAEVVAAVGQVRAVAPHVHVGADAAAFVLEAGAVGR